MSHVISLQSVGFAYGISARPVFSDVSFTIGNGSRVVLVGANGAGKSTLLRLIAGRRKASQGAANVLGNDAFEHTENTLRVNLVTADWDEDLTFPVEKLVRNAVVASGVGAARVASLLQVLGIAELLHAELHALSDGQKRRVQLFCKLLPERELVLLDEATNSLDVLSRASLLAFLRDESELRGCTVVFCTHIFDGLDGWATELVHIDGGKLCRHVSAANLPPGQSVYQTVSGWLTDHAREMRERLVAERGAPSLDALAAALVAGGSDGATTDLTKAAWPLSPKRTRPLSPSPDATAEVQRSSSVTESLPEGWGERQSAIPDGAFGAHSWTAARPPGLDEGVPTTLFTGEAAVEAPRPASPDASESRKATERAQPEQVPPLPVSAPTTAPGERRAPELSPDAQRLAPVLQGALSMLATRIEACSAAVGKGDAREASAEAATIKGIWEQVEAAMSKFQAAQGGGEVRLSPAVPMPAGSSAGGDTSMPFGWGNRHATETDLVRSGKIAPPTPLSGSGP